MLTFELKVPTLIMGDEREIHWLERLFLVLFQCILLKWPLILIQVKVIKRKKDFATAFYQLIQGDCLIWVWPCFVVLWKLEKQHSPLLKDLMSCLKEVMKDYRSEVQEVLSADKQLANEIEFDLKRFEEQQKEREEQRRKQNTPNNSLQVWTFSHSGNDRAFLGEGLVSTVMRYKMNEGFCWIWNYLKQTSWNSFVFIF